MMRGELPNQNESGEDECGHCDFLVMYPVIEKVGHRKVITLPVLIEPDEDPDEDGQDQRNRQQNTDCGG